MTLDTESVNEHLNIYTERKIIVSRTNLFIASMISAVESEIVTCFVGATNHVSLKQITKLDAMVVDIMIRRVDTTIKIVDSAIKFVEIMK